MPQRILIADDEPKISRIAQISLERAGFEVSMVLDGKEALEALRSGEPLPDLLLMDLTMPHMDGFAALEIIKADPALADLPVILMTARSRTEEFHEARLRGAAAFLVKPVSPNELVSTVKEILQGQPVDPA